MSCALRCAATFLPHLNAVVGEGVIVIDAVADKSLPIVPTARDMIDRTRASIVHACSVASVGLVQALRELKDRAVVATESVVVQVLPSERSFDVQEGGEVVGKVVTLWTILPCKGGTSTRAWWQGCKRSESV